jgi:hypothetical protein
MKKIRNQRFLEGLKSASGVFESVWGVLEIINKTDSKSATFCLLASIMLVWKDRQRKHKEIKFYTKFTYEHQGEKPKQRISKSSPIDMMMS